MWAPPGQSSQGKTGICARVPGRGCGKTFPPSQSHADPGISFARGNCRGSGRPEGRQGPQETPEEKELSRRCRRSLLNNPHKQLHQLGFGPGHGGHDLFQGGRGHGVREIKVAEHGDA